MAETELHVFAMENGWTELEKRIATLETPELFSNLDDTIQFDILGASAEEWAQIRSKKVVYNTICREILKRCRE